MDEAYINESQSHWLTHSKYLKLSKGDYTYASNC